MNDTILFNDKDILIEGKPFLNKERFSNNIRSIRDTVEASISVDPQEVETVSLTGAGRLTEYKDCMGAR